MKYYSDDITWCDNRKCTCMKCELNVKHRCSCSDTSSCLPQKCRKSISNGVGQKKVDSILKAAVNTERTVLSDGKTAQGLR